ncbi:MAG TPA: hypothetical protein VK612_09975, partial [Pyrinomonadaceae bacterium]|nr:hypothetical protein [Pyrinomonadaceae bacterium]
MKRKRPFPERTDPQPLKRPRREQPPNGDRAKAEPSNSGIIFGVSPVLEALRSNVRRIQKI